MGASAYVGRVGGLAVALGVGIAIATGGHGVAWADGTGDPGGTTSQDTQAGDAAGTPSTSGGTNADVASDPGEAAVGKRPVSIVNVRGGSILNSRLADLSKKAEKRLQDLRKASETKRVTEGTDRGTVKDIDSNASGQTPIVSGESTSTAPSLRTRTSKPVIKSAPSVRTFNAGIPAPSRVATAKGEPVVATAAVAQKAAQVATTATSAVAAAAKVASVTQAAATPLRTVVTQAAETPVEQMTSTTVLNRLLGVIGFNPLASGTPVAPVQPWALGALMALASRRETEQSVASMAKTGAVGGSTAAAAVAAAAPYDPAKDYVVTPTPVSGNTDYIANVTGPGGLNDTERRFGIGGTDVGIIWDNGIKDNPATTVNEHQVLIAFGDTFSQRNPVRTGVWRMNTLFRSSDSTLSNGMYVPDGIPHDPGMYSGTPESNLNFSREIIGNYHYGIGPEVTMIPTAAISVPGAGKNGATRQYVNFMAVRSWDTPGRWTTNYSAIAYSDDNGQNWTVVPPESVRPAAAGRSTRPFINGNQNFQQFAYVKGAVVDANGVPIKDASGQPKTDGYVYAYGTPAGRGGTAYLSRVKEGQILDQAKYEYWSGTAWVANNPAAAKPILPGTTTTSWFGLVKTTTYPTVGEMSVQYNAYEKKYVMLYADQNNNVVMRKADKPEGPWSTPTTLVTSAKMPGLYAPMVHPWSSTDNLSSSDQQYLYWNLSTWDDYQVKLMRTDLSKV